VTVTFQAFNTHAPPRVVFGRPVLRTVELPPPHQDLHFANRNARAVLTLLGFDSADLAGERSLPQCRRGLMRARASFNRFAPELTEPTRTVLGPPRQRPDGVLELRPVRGWIQGLGEQGLWRRLEEFAAFVEAAAAHDADLIGWG